MTNAAPPLFAGLDVSLAAGEFARVASSGASIAIETGATTPWLWRELRGRGLPVICIDVRHANRVL